MLPERVGARICGALVHAGVSHPSGIPRRALEAFLCLVLRPSVILPRAHLLQLIWSSIVRTTSQSNVILLIALMLAERLGFDRKTALALGSTSRLSHCLASHAVPGLQIVLGKDYAGNSELIQTNKCSYYQRFYFQYHESIRTINEWSNFVICGL